MTLSMFPRTRGGRLEINMGKLLNLHSSDFNTVQRGNNYNNNGNR